MKCKTCGGEMIQKSRTRLVIVGVLMIAVVAIAPFVQYLWGPAIVVGLTGGYLLIWASLGKGGWCRSCKKFSFV